MLDNEGRKWKKQRRIDEAGGESSRDKEGEGKRTREERECKIAF